MESCATARAIYILGTPSALTSKCMIAITGSVSFGRPWLYPFHIQWET